MSPRDEGDQGFGRRRVASRTICVPTVSPIRASSPAAWTVVVTMSRSAGATCSAFGEGVLAVSARARRVAALGRVA